MKEGSKKVRRQQRGRKEKKGKEREGPAVRTKDKKE
jgi:hypothetical protein